MESIIIIIIGGVIAGLLPVIVFRNKLKHTMTEDINEMYSSGLKVITNDSTKTSNSNDYLSLEKAEIELIKRTLEKTQGNRKKAARLLGVSIGLLGYKLDKYKITDDV
jgi:transcriptional regulator with PAS, ATPase and Fis domain